MEEYDPDFVLEAMALDVLGEPDKALDIIYNNMDDLLLQGRFEEANSKLLRDPQALSVRLMLALLTTASWAKEHMTHYDDFRAKCVAEIEDRGEMEPGLLDRL